MLGNEETRKIYDRYGEEGLKQHGGGGGGHDANDIFSQYASHDMSREQCRYRYPAMHASAVLALHLRPLANGAAL